MYLKSSIVLIALSVCSGYQTTFFRYLFVRYLSCSVGLGFALTSFMVGSFMFIPTGVALCFTITLADGLSLVSILSVFKNFIGLKSKSYTFLVWCFV